jgi:3-hydroxyacyl-[acyl-carrier-protein] dehydratase
MRWRFLKKITELSDRRAVAAASTDFPDEIFSDHFPSFPVTPGVLLIEMCAQLAGRLVEIRCSQRAGVLILPVLTIVRDAKFRGFVPPGTSLQISAELEHARPESALCAAEVESQDQRYASIRLIFAFDPTGELQNGSRAAIEAYERQEFLRLGLRGFPPGTVSVEPLNS